MWSLSIFWWLVLVPIFGPNANGASLPDCQQPSVIQVIVDVSQPLSASTLNNMRQFFKTASFEVLAQPQVRKKGPVKWDKGMDFNRFAQEHLNRVQGEFSLNSGLLDMNIYNMEKQRDGEFLELIVFSNSLPPTSSALLVRYSKATFGFQAVRMNSPPKSLMLFVPMQADFRPIDVMPSVRRMFFQVLDSKCPRNDLICNVKQAEKVFCIRGLSKERQRMINQFFF